MSETKMEALIGRIDADGIADDSSAIAELLARMPRKDVNEMALRWVLTCMRKRVRETTLVAERRASSTDGPMHESVGAAPRRRTIGGRHTTPDNWKNPNSMGKHEWEQFANSPEYPKWAEGQSRLESSLAESTRHMMDSISSAMDSLKTGLRLEWTTELLSSTFNLSDGTSVTWGEATREQHEQRIAMFQANAAANIEGAARHQLAIDELDKTGVMSLNEATRPVEEAAAA